MCIRDSLVFFGPLVDLTGCRRDVSKGQTLDQIIEESCRRFGDRFAAALASCSIWVDGEPAQPGAPIRHDAEVAFLPPVSGG